MIRRQIQRLRLRPGSLLELAGYVAMAFGVGVVYVPAGIVAAGIFAVFLAQGVEQ